MEKIQSKLIQFSVEIEDKVKYIALLQDAINQEGLNHENDKKDLEDKFKNLFRERSNGAKTSYSQLIAKCNDGLEEKKEATIQLNKSVVMKKKVTQENKKKIDKITKEKKREMEKEKIQWKIEAKRQREIWLERKGKEIRDITIKGLEPEIKQLVKKHDSECNRIKSESEAAKQTTTINIQNEYATKLKYAQEENESRHSKNIDESRIALRRKLDEENDRQAKTLTKIRDQFSRDIDSQRKWYKDELRKMTAFYASEIESIKSATDKRLLDMDDTFLNEKQQIICQIENEIQKMEAIVDDSNKDWMDKIKSILEVERNEALAMEHKKLQKERDDILDQIIRKNQRDISSLSGSINSEYNDESKTCDLLHEKALRVTSESLDSWNKKHQLQQGEIYSIETKKQNIRRDIESKDESLREMKEKVKQLELTLQKRKVNFESQVNQNENNYSMEVMSTEQELNDLNEKNNNLDVEAKLKIRKHEQMKKDLEKTHNDTMEHLEQELKRAIDINNAKRREIMEEMKEEELHIEHMRLIAKSYGSNRSKKYEA